MCWPSFYLTKWRKKKNWHHKTVYITFTLMLFIYVYLYLLENSHYRSTSASNTCVLQWRRFTSHPRTTNASAEWLVSGGWPCQRNKSWRSTGLNLGIFLIWICHPLPLTLSLFNHFLFLCNWFRKFPKWDKTRQVNGALIRLHTMPLHQSLVEKLTGKRRHRCNLLRLISGLLGLWHVILEGVWSHTPAILNA